MKTFFGWILLVLWVGAWPVSAGETPAWQKAQPGYQWSFPADLASHPDYKTEWWYVTGHLNRDEDPEAEPLGFQLTFFRIGLTPGEAPSDASAWQPHNLVMAHAALSNPDSAKHTFSEVIWRATPFLGGFGAPGDSLLAWCRAPTGTDADWSLVHRDSSFHLSVRDDSRGLQFNLICTPSRARVFHGDRGFSPKTPEGDSGSLYFSRTRMQVRGSVVLKGKKVEVTGQSWLDREIFTSTLGRNQRGWDWAALNLVDGTDLMLYRLRNQQGQEDFALGTLVKPGHPQQPMPADSWDLEPKKYWTSPVTGTRYPVEWELNLAGRDFPLLIRASQPNQENVSERSGIHYWEGAVTVHPLDDTGTILGRGFIELTGYGDDSRPPV